jgi:glycosyltransferase involved in cell wall biosynthesis
MPNPLVSVVLPVYNCPNYVGEAIQSVLAQTFHDYELLVIDDGSTDETPSVLARYRDSRVRVMTQSNRGLAATLNRGIELAKGRYIARQDQDDFSYPQRLARQVAFLEAHPGCGLVGTWADIWRENASTGRQHRHPSGNALLQYQLLLNNPFVHSSVMIRKAALDRVGPYSTDNGRQPPEDYELWSRVARVYEVSNIPEVLHMYREVPGSMSRDGRSPFLEHLVTISAENIAWAAEADPASPQVVNIAALAHGAIHRLQGELDVRAMTAIFVRAARRVAGERQARQIERMAADLIDGMCYHRLISQKRSRMERLAARLGRRLGMMWHRARSRASWE